MREQTNVKGVLGTCEKPVGAQQGMGRGEDQTNALAEGERKKESLHRGW